MKTTSRFSLRALLLTAILAVTACDSVDNSDADKLAGLQGQWLLINYWAAWCKPCIEEIPELNEFAKTHAQQVALFGVNFDGASGTQLATQIKQLQIEFPTLASDPASQLGYERPTVLPATIIINPRGELHRILLGPQTQASLAGALQL